MKYNSIDGWKTIGEVLKNVRKERGLTQEQLAKLIGKSKRTIQHYESGQTEIPQDVLIKISSKLQTTKLFIYMQEIFNENIKTLCEIKEEESKIAIEISEKCPEFFDYLGILGIDVKLEDDGFLFSFDDTNEGQIIMYTLSVKEMILFQEKIKRLIQNEVRFSKPDADEREVYQLFNENNRLA